MPDSAQPTNQKPVLLQIRHLSKSYGDTQILQNINLDIYDGEFLTLLGPSGCGKTTLLRLIGGFELPNAGSLHLEGVDIAGLPAEKRPINTVFQQYALFPHMNVYDNIAYGLKLKGVPKTEIDQRVREALAMVQLDHTINRRPQDLSGGQQQRIASRYAELVKDVELREAIFERIRAEHQITVEAVLKITGQQELLDGNLLLKRSIRNRFPYLDPLNHVQVEMLRRHREAAGGNGSTDERIRIGIHISINGIAAGLRNSG